MLFSIVIPVYNHAARLAAALQSVALQKFEDYEIIIVDDASDEEVTTSIAAMNLPVRLFRQEVNRGPGAARNLGIRAALGEYVAFLDSDDTWFPWTLAVYNEAIIRSDAPSFVAGREAASDEWAVAQPAELKIKRYPDYYSAASDDVWIGTCAAVVRTSVLREVGGFNEERMNAEDSDLWLRLGCAPGFVQILDPPVFRYHRTSDSLVGHCQLTRLGIETLVTREKAGCYPGGAMRMRERRRILGRHIRPYLVAALRRGEWSHARDLYSATFRWLLMDHRIKFLLGFWWLFIMELFAARRQANR